MYTGKLLHALAKTYEVLLLQGASGYFSRLSEFYLKHDFPPEFTENTPPTPGFLIQEYRKNKDEAIINKLINSLLDEFSIGKKLEIPLEAKFKVSNIFYFPEKGLNDLLTELRKIKYVKRNQQIISIPTKEKLHLDFMPETRNRVSSVVAKGIEQLLGDFPFEKNVFVMMKFPNDSLESNIKQSLEEIWNTINLTLHQNYGLRALRADRKDYTQGGWLWDNVCVYMESSIFGIAVLENLVSTEFNPNVAIEFGYMKGLGRTVLLLKEKSFSNIRADLIGRLWKDFSASDKPTIKKTISDAIHNWAVDNRFQRLAG